MAIAASLLAAVTVNRSVQNSNLPAPATPKPKGMAATTFWPATYNDLRLIASTAAPTTDQTLDLTSAWIAYRRCSKERP